jgi:hypothetical protein
MPNTNNKVAQALLFTLRLEGPVRIFDHPEPKSAKRLAVLPLVVVMLFFTACNFSDAAKTSNPAPVVNAAAKSPAQMPDENTPAPEST